MSGSREGRILGYLTQILAANNQLAVMLKLYIPGEQGQKAKLAFENSVIQEMCLSFFWLEGQISSP